jgi:phytoene desaturase
MPPSIISGEVAARDIHRKLTGAKELSSSPSLSKSSHA